MLKSKNNRFTLVLILMVTKVLDLKTIHILKLFIFVSLTLRMFIMKTARIATIDVFRALTMFLMLFVNDIPGIKQIPHWLLHAKMDEDMLGFSDIIFPCFLFVMGMSVPFAILKRQEKGESLGSTLKHIFERTIALIIMGLFTVNLGSYDGNATGLPYSWYVILLVISFFLTWNLYPKAEGKKKYLYEGLKIVGRAMILGLFILFEGKNGATFGIKWWGILGLIGWTYLVTAIVFLIARIRLVWIPMGCHFLADEEIDHKQQHQNHLNAEPHNGRKHIGNRRRQSGEIDLAKDTGIFRKGVGIVAKAGVEIVPDSVTGQIEQQHGNAIGLNAGDTAEDKGLDNGAEQRGQKNPGWTQHGLLIGHHKIPLGKQINQVPILPDLFQIQIQPVMPGGYMGVIIGCIFSHEITSSF